MTVGHGWWPPRGGRASGRCGGTSSPSSGFRPRRAGLGVGSHPGCDSCRVGRVPGGLAVCPSLRAAATGARLWPARHFLERETEARGHVTHVPCASAQAGQALPTSGGERGVAAGPRPHAPRQALPCPRCHSAHFPRPLPGDQAGPAQPPLPTTSSLSWKGSHGNCAAAQAPWREVAEAEGGFLASQPRASVSPECVPLLPDRKPPPGSSPQPPASSTQHPAAQEAAPSTHPPRHRDPRGAVGTRHEAGTQTLRGPHAWPAHCAQTGCEGRWPHGSPGPVEVS